MPRDDAPADVRLVSAFLPLCSTEAAGTSPRGCPDGAHAFTRNWLRYYEDLEPKAHRGVERFLHRYEWPSLWETAEVQGELHRMWSDVCESEDPSGFGDAPEHLDPEHCHDREKPRATVAQYAALLSTQVASNLEGIARARFERRPRQSQSGASVHQAYMKATSGGSETG